MVTTASAVFTASATESARRQPAAAALSRAAVDRSKAMTSRPAFAWLAAIPPPMFPRPMNATRDMDYLDLLRLAELQDELVGMAANRRVEHRLGVVVGGVAEHVAFALELEARALQLL